MCARQDHHFGSWLRTLGMESFLEIPGTRGAHRSPTVADIEELEAELRVQMKQRTQSELMNLFLEHDVGADPFLYPTEFLDDPEKVDNGPL